MSISPQTVYAHLQLIEEMSVSGSALCRQLAQEILADPKVSLVWRQAISDRLNQANRHLSQFNSADNEATTLECGNESDSY